MLVLKAPFILYDTEFTSWEGSKERGWSGKGEYREILQIGAIEVDAALAPTRSFLCYVIPTVNPTLSDFITNLTGITQADIATRGVSLEKALTSFKAFAGDRPLWAYGGDAQVMKENCELVGIAFPFERWDQFFNVRIPMRKILWDMGIDYGAYSSGSLLEAFGQKGTGRVHDALGDMENLLAALRVLRDKGVLHVS